MVQEEFEEYFYLKDCKEDYQVQEEFEGVFYLKEEEGQEEEEVQEEEVDLVYLKKLLHYHILFLM